MLMFRRARRKERWGSYVRDLGIRVLGDYGCMVAEGSVCGWQPHLVAEAIVDAVPEIIIMQFLYYITVPRLYADA